MLKALIDCLIDKTCIICAGLEMKMIKKHMEIKCVECIIPKGTTYYENKLGEIVTERLTIKELY